MVQQELNYGAEAFAWLAVGCAGVVFYVVACAVISWVMAGLDVDPLEGWDDEE